MRPFPAGASCADAGKLWAVAQPITQPLAGWRIVLVENDDDSRELMALWLSLQGVTVDAASGAIEAISFIRAGRPDAVV